MADDEWMDRWMDLWICGWMDDDVGVGGCRRFPRGSPGLDCGTRRHTRTRKSRRWCVRPRPRPRISRKKNFTTTTRDGIRTTVVSTVTRRWGDSQRVEILAELYPGEGEGRRKRKNSDDDDDDDENKPPATVENKPFPFFPRARRRPRVCARSTLARIETNHPRGFADDDAIARSIAIGVVIGTVDTRVVASGYSRGGFGCGGFGCVIFLSIRFPVPGRRRRRRMTAGVPPVTRGLGWVGFTTLVST